MGDRRLHWLRDKSNNTGSRLWLLLASTVPQGWCVQQLSRGRVEPQGLVPRNFEVDEVAELKVLRGRNHRAQGNVVCLYVVQNLIAKMLPGIHLHRKRVTGRG